MTTLKVDLTKLLNEATEHADEFATTAVSRMTATRPGSEESLRAVLHELAVASIHLGGILEMAESLGYKPGDIEVACVTAMQVGREHAKHANAQAVVIRALKAAKEPAGGA